MSHSHSNDVFVGPGEQRTERAPIIIEAGQEHAITGAHNGGVCVHESGSVVVTPTGIHNGSLCVERGARATIRGTHNGSIDVRFGGYVEIFGRQNGSITVERGGVLRVAERAVAAGSLHIEGRFENAGTRGGSVSGSGDIIDLPGAVVKQPTIRNGISYYSF